MSKIFRILSFGGGTNSTAVLVGFAARGIRPDAILFSDTGGEKPHTYDHLAEMQDWCDANDMPEITVLRGSQPQQIRDGSLEAECLRLKTLPSRVFGFGSCSHKWKVVPQEKWLKVNLPEGHEVRWVVGFDAGEDHRAARMSDEQRATREFPLIEWGWEREDCISAIKSAGITPPGKSACWYCPSTKKAEINQLKNEYPELFVRALEMEQNALEREGDPLRVKGLGRHWSWADHAQAEQDAPDQACFCFDGD